MKFAFIANIAGATPETYSAAFEAPEAYNLIAGVDGMDAARAFIEKFILCDVPVTRLHNADYKTALQELVQQKKNQQLSYVLTGESGPDHNKCFQVAVFLNGEQVGQGSGSSKKRAEQDAARVALETLSQD